MSTGRRRSVVVCAAEGSTNADSNQVSAVPHQIRCCMRLVLSLYLRRVSLFQRLPDPLLHFGDRLHDKLLTVVRLLLPLHLRSESLETVGWGQWDGGNERWGQ